MPITVDTLKFFQSERMTDQDDGGGRMTATAIVSGADNQIFDDVSDVDRAAGDVSLRKVYAAVTSTDTDKYLDAGVIVFRAPADPDVSVLAFSTASFYDQRADLKDRLEQTVVRGSRWNGWLWGHHVAGQRAITLWQRPEVELPAVGQRLELVAKAGSVEQYSQFVWLTRITSTPRTMYEAQGTITISYLINEVTCEIAEPLEQPYTGVEPSRGDPVPDATASLVYNSRYNANAVALFGLAPVTANATTGDFSLKVASLYQPIIPTSLAETALADTNPGGDSPALVAGNAGTVTFTTTTPCVKPGVNLYCGAAVFPGTFSLSVSGATLTDDNGAVKLAGAVVGEIDYGNGLVRWNDTVPNYGAAAKTVTFRPATRPLRVADSAAQVVTAEGRGYVYVLTLAPIPAPGTLRVAYRVNNRWYVLTDQGAGRLAGADSSYGSAVLNFSTGTVTLTTGALPDVDSEIIYIWATPVNYTARGGDPVDAPVVRGQTAHPGVAPGTASVAWTVGGTTYSLDDDPAADGALTGAGGVGGIRYATGEWWVRPTTVPPVNTVFTLVYDYGPPVEETFAHPIREGNGHLHLTLAHVPRENTVEVEWNLLIDKPDPLSTTPAEMIPHPIQVDPIKIIRDNGSGVLAVSGGTNGTVDYANQVVDWLPDVIVSVPWPRYSTTWLGVIGSGQNIKSVFRNVFTHFEYVDSPAQYPIDESGWVKVRYRTAGGDTSATETVTLTTLELDLTKGYGETITAGSARFRLGDSLYVETAGQLYRDPGPDTGAGSLAGSIDRSAGVVRITAWPAGGSNAVTLESLVTELAGQPIEEVVFRTPVAPLRPGSVQLRWQLLTGAVKTKTIDATGILEDTDASITVNAELGVIRARFGQWKVDSTLTPTEKAQVWYDADARVDFGGTLKIWKPAPALADSVIYNAVAQIVLPPDSALLGLNAARLPVDGKGLVFRTGQLVLVHHTASLTETTLSPNQVIDCGRTRLYRVVIEDANGQRLSASAHTLDRAAGTLTLAANLDLTGFAGPYTVLHTIADLARVVQTDINGTLTLNRALSHDYPADDSRVSGVLYAGNLQARVANVFAQSTWTSEWSDTLIGSEPLAQYNDALYPIITSNAGAYPDRFLVRFTNATSFQVIGEHLGLIAVGDINNDCAPINALTGQTYFTLDHRGWGAGWATGNCLRFNLVGAAFPVDLIRAIQPSEPNGETDHVELLFVGNVDA